MRALQLTANRTLAVVDLPEPPPRGAGGVQITIGAVALNHIDVWGWRGMAFAKRKLPIVVGVEAAGTVDAVGEGVVSLAKGDIVAIFGAETCGVCAPCRAGRDNFCENVHGIRGFHVDGLARGRVNLSARLAVKAPPGVGVVSAACAPVTYGTPEHMLFDNAKLAAGQTILIQAGGSGVGTAAIQLFQLYQQQLRLIGSFGCTIRNLADSLAKMAAGVTAPVIDSTIALEEIDAALARMESRQVFGKIIVTL